MVRVRAFGARLVEQDEVRPCLRQGRHEAHLDRRAAREVAHLKSGSYSVLGPLCMGAALAVLDVGIGRRHDLDVIDGGAGALGDAGDRQFGTFAGPSSEPGHDPADETAEVVRRLQRNLAGEP